MKPYAIGFIAGLCLLIGMVVGVQLNKQNQETAEELTQERLITTGEYAFNKGFAAGYICGYYNFEMDDGKVLVGPMKSINVGKLYTILEFNDFTGKVENDFTLDIKQDLGLVFYRGEVYITDGKDSVKIYITCD